MLKRDTQSTQDTITLYQIFYGIHDVPAIESLYWIDSRISDYTTAQ